MKPLYIPFITVPDNERTDTALFRETDWSIGDKQSLSDKINLFLENITILDKKKTSKSL